MSRVGVLKFVYVLHGRGIQPQTEEQNDTLRQWDCEEEGMKKAKENNQISIFLTKLAMQLSTISCHAQCPMRTAVGYRLLTHTVQTY